jgi:glutamate/tyrosine decarboxylase-like PLP-dependent enzyme
MSAFDADFSALPQLAERVSRWCIDFQQTLPQRPVGCLDAPGVLPGNLPESGGGAADSLAHFERTVAPFLSASAGPRYLGFVTGGTTPAALLGDWLVAACDQNVASPGDSISSAVELQVLAWLRQLLDLPDSFSGILTSGATAANLLGVVCGRQFAGLQQGLDIARDGLAAASIQVFSATPHASAQKALGFAGLGRNQFTRVACLADSEAMDVNALAAALQHSPAAGKIVLASAGTVTGTDFDDLAAIAALCRSHRAWLHVDGAFGLFSRLSAARSSWTRGVELADSITCDGHKWLNVPYDCGIFFTRHADILQQACSVSAPYLDVESSLPAFMDRGIENSRRFRALPLWLSLQAYGRQGFAQLIENNCRQAALLADWITQSPDYELLHPCQLNVVVFCPSSSEVPVKQRLQQINLSGKVLMTPGAWQGQSAIRAAFSNWRTTAQDVESVCAILASCAGR